MWCGGIPRTRLQQGPAFHFWGANDRSGKIRAETSLRALSRLDAGYFGRLIQVVESVLEYYGAQAICIHIESYNIHTVLC